MTKIISRLSIVILISLTAHVADAQTVKVACVGDSITALPTSWCGDLATKLGSGYMVKNFGVSGTNLAKGVSQPYWDSAQYTPSHTFAPNIVIIMLGTNDAFSFSWSGAKTHFVKDYEELLDTYTSLASKPKPYMIIPTPIGTSPFGHDGNLLATEVIPLVKQVAMEKMVPTIDAFTLFGGTMFDPGLYGAMDQVHPNAKGQQMICDEVYKVLMSTGALGGSAAAGSGATAGTGATAGSGGMAGATAGATTTAGTSAGAAGMAGGANAGGAGAGSMTPSGAAGTRATAGSSATPASSGNTAGKAGAAGSTSVAGAGGSATAGNSSMVNGVGLAGSAPLMTTPASSGDGGCRTTGSSTNSNGPTAALVLLLGLAVRSRRRHNRTGKHAQRT